MKIRRGFALAGVLGMLGVFGALSLAGAAPASATGTYSATTAIERGTHWLPFVDPSRYANEPKVLPGVYNFRITLTNHTTQPVSITSADTGIAGASTVCTTPSIAPKKSASCTIAVTIVSGSTSFSTQIFLSTNQVFELAPHVVIGVTYDLTTTMTLSTPGGTVSPGDASLLQLPLGYRPVARVIVQNGSTVTITSITVPGFNTSSCSVALKALTANTEAFCTNLPATLPASTVEVALNTGGVGNGVFAGDRPGLGISLSYQGVGGCTATLATVTAGHRQTVSCTGFVPSIVTGSVMHSNLVSLGSHTTAPDGSLQFSFIVPASTSGGTHHVSITVGGSSVAAAFFHVTAVPQLATTGDDPTPLLIAAVLLIALGVALRLGMRPRRP